LERTLVLLKPDSVQRNLSGEIINRIEKIGFKIIGLKLMILDQTKAHEHYKEHKSKPFFNDLVSFITSGPIVAIAFQGPNCVKKIRNINGSTDPTEASPGTIRGDFGISLSMNLIHSSDSIESAQRELKIFFEKSELVDYNKNIDEWILE
jgi:nucleoside-diphosphate kinase|tara:strand:- start:163 stop:612 length:450 start_codon:yes stop_codon:yes gene_type:complete